MLRQLINCAFQRFICFCLVTSVAGAAAHASSVTIANAALSATETGAAATSITVSATATDSNPANSSGAVYALFYCAQQLPQNVKLSEGANDHFSGTIDLPVNTAAQAVNWTVTIQAGFGDDFAQQTLALKQDSAGPPTITVDLSTTGGTALTALDPAGDSVQVTALVDSPLNVSQVQLQVSSPSATTTNINLENDSALGANAYTGIVDIPANPLPQMIPWTFTVIASAGTNTGTISDTLNQSSGGPPSISNITVTPSFSEADEGGTVDISANITSATPITAARAVINNALGQGDTATLTKSTGSTYTGSFDVGENSTNFPIIWNVNVIANSGINQAGESTTYTQAPPPAPEFSSFTLSPSSSEGPGGGPLSISINIDGILPDAGVSAVIETDEDGGGGEVGLRETSPGTYTGTYYVPQNTTQTPINYDVAIVVGNIPFYVIYGVVHKAFTEAAAGAPVYTPSVSVSGIQSASGGINQFAAGGDTATLTVGASSTSFITSTPINRVRVLAYANGVPVGVPVEDEHTSNGVFDEKVTIPPNDSGAAIAWTFLVTDTDAYTNFVSTTSGPINQPYAAPVLTNPTLDAGAFDAAGGTTTVSVNAASSDGTNGLTAHLFANGVLSGGGPLGLNGDINNQFGNGSYSSTFGIPPNASGTTLDWFASLVDVNGGEGSATTSTTHVTQPFVLSLAAAGVTSSSVPNTAFKFTGDTANFTVQATAGDQISVFVTVYRNGVFADEMPLTNTTGQQHSSGTYTGTFAIIPNTIGATINWQFVYEAIDTGGNFVTAAPAIVIQPYQLPILTNPILTPGNFIPNAGVAETVAVTANSADGTNHVVAYAFDNGTYYDSFPLLNAGAQTANGVYNGVLTIPAVIIGEDSWTFVISDVDASGNGSSISAGPVIQGPVITGIVPPAVQSEKSIPLLTVNGGNFGNGDVVDWNGTALPTTFAGGALTVANIPTSVNGLVPGDTYPGTVQIIVTQSDATTSAPFPLTVTEPIPLISSLSPSAAFATGAGFTITVSGSYFGTGATVIWTPSLPAAPVALATTFVNNTTLTAVVPANLIGSIGMAAVSVTQLGGTPSAAPPVLFNVVLPPLAPTITSIAPVDGPTGSTVVITGTNFSGAGFMTTAVRFNGATAKFTTTSATSITATVPASATTGGVTVTTPGGMSNAKTFTVTAGHTFGPGLTMMAVPADYSASSLASVLGYASPKLAIWEPSSQSYSVTPTAPANSLVPGIGYWVRFPAVTSITTGGSATSTSAPFTVALSAGWNMIGDPFPVAVPIGNVMVTPSGGAAESMTAAAQNGLVESSLFTYQSGDTNYEVLSTGSDSLVPYAGYWIYVSHNCSISIPVP